MFHIQISVCIAGLSLIYFFHIQIALMFKQINFILCFLADSQQLVEKKNFIRKVLYVEQKISHQRQSCIITVEISVLFFCRILCEQEKLSIKINHLRKIFLITIILYSYCYIHIVVKCRSNKHF